MAEAEALLVTVVRGSLESLQIRIADNAVGDMPFRAAGECNGQSFNKFEKLEN